LGACRPQKSDLHGAPDAQARAGEGNAPRALKCPLLCTTRRRRFDHYGSNSNLGYRPRLRLNPGNSYFQTSRRAGRESSTRFTLLVAAFLFSYGTLVESSRTRHSSRTAGLPIAPSAIRAEGQTYTAQGFKPLVTPRALETAEGFRASSLIFARLPSNADHAGFDGVEMHGANGYLIDRFLRDKNQPAHRSIRRKHRKSESFSSWKLLTLLVDGIGADRIGLRISPQNTFNDIDDSNPRALFNYVAASLSGKGLAYLHVVEGDLTGKAGWTLWVRKDQDALRSSLHCE